MIFWKLVVKPSLKNLSSMEAAVAAPADLILPLESGMTGWAECAAGSPKGLTYLAAAGGAELGAAAGVPGFKYLGLPGSYQEL